MCSLVRCSLAIRTAMTAALRHLTRSLFSSDTLMLHHMARWCTQLDAELATGSSNRSRRSGWGECTEAGGRAFILQGPDPFSTCRKILFAGGPAAMSPVHRAPGPDRPSQGWPSLFAPATPPPAPPPTIPVPCLKASLSTPAPATRNTRRLDPDVSMALRFFQRHRRCTVQGPCIPHSAQ